MNALLLYDSLIWLVEWNLVDKIFMCELRVMKFYESWDNRGLMATILQNKIISQLYICKK